MKKNIARISGRTIELLPIIAMIALIASLTIPSARIICSQLYEVPLEKAPFLSKSISLLLGTGCGFVGTIVFVAILALLCCFLQLSAYLLKKIFPKKEKEY